MNKHFGFRVYRMNMDPKVNDVFIEDPDMESYDAADGGGTCFFSETIATWRQNEDWYCSICCEAPCNEAQVEEAVLQAYEMIYEETHLPREEWICNPTLLFYNEEIF